MASLTRRYIVMTLATEASFDHRAPDGAFVLKPWKDPAALRALRTYRDNCFPELRRDICVQRGRLRLKLCGPVPECPRGVAELGVGAWRETPGG